MMLTRWGGADRSWSDGQPDEGTDKEAEMSDFPAKILVATDGSEDAMLAARTAISLAHDTGAELHVVHVGPAHVYPPRASGPTPPTGTDQELRREAQGVLDWQVEEIKKAGGEITEAYLRMGHPAEEILRLSEEIIAGLIVLGNQGLGGRFSRLKRFLMGSVSEKVSRYARCSVMVVRTDLYDRPPV
jgi:nucleotide-binding universal stress UspA family protein